MTTRLNISKRLSDAAYNSSLDVRVNCISGGIRICNASFSFEGYSFISGPEFRDGRYPCFHIVYGAGKRSALEGDVLRLQNLAGIVVKGELEEPHSHVHFLDLVFPEGSFVLVGNDDKIFSMKND